jgi:hypothetical protein
MKPHVFVIPLLALTALAGCFMSTEPRIAAGVLLADGPVAFCLPDEDPCQTGLPDGDGYLIQSEDEDEEDVRLRFEALTEVDGVVIYLSETELSDEADRAWTYLVARSAGETPDGLAQFDLMMPSCSDLPPEQGERFGIIHADAYSCTVTDLEGFRAYLIETYTDDFADPAWWADED